MKRLFAVLAVLALLSGIFAAYAENAPEGIPLTTKITARCASVEEGQRLMRERTLFHEQITEGTLAFFLQRKGGTLDAYIEYSAEQVMEFDPEDEKRLDETLDWLQSQLEKYGLELPDPGEITFVKSSGQEALGSAGYTTEGTIFLTWFTFLPEYYTDGMFRELVVHELFHCLSRLYPEFRTAMYSLIHFSLLDGEIDIPEDIRNRIIANPDVEHHNSYATFTIGGEKKDCYLVFLTDSVFEKEGDNFFSGMYSGIVPLDGSGLYRPEEVEDFWDVVGRNTDYAEDPEEIMATNFAYAITHLDEGYEGFQSPEIPEGIVDLLRTGSPAETAAAEETGVPGKPFPDFTVTDSQGNTFTLSEALKDHEAVLINIWTSWCPPCEMEMPFLNEVYERYGDRVAVIALSAEAGDTPEIIEAYREAHGIRFPMGRDEGTALYQYLGADGYPTTVIVDRFGNAGFVHIGSFLSTGEVERTVCAFLGDGYTETVTLAEVPKDASTRALPVSAATAVAAENESARPVVFLTEEDPEPTQAYVISDDTARLRLDVAASDNPAGMILYDYVQNTLIELPELLDPERGVYVYETAMPGADDDIHYNCVGLVDSDSGEYAALAYLIAGDEYIEEFAEAMRSVGYTVSWKYAEPAAAEQAAAEAYILHITDQNNMPVPEVFVNFCTDTSCTPCMSDESGTITFRGEPGIYHIQLLEVPEGYSFDPGFEAYTGNSYSEWVLRIRKD